MMPTQTNQCAIHGNKNLSNLPLPHQTTHLHTYQKEVTNELRATALCGLWMTPHCWGVWCVGHEGSWDEFFSAELSTSPESWSLVQCLSLVLSMLPLITFCRMKSIYCFTLLFSWSLISPELHWTTVRKSVFNIQYLICDCLCQCAYSQCHWMDII